MKFKVGDKVTVKSLDDIKAVSEPDHAGDLICERCAFIIDGMSEHCGHDYMVILTKTNDDGYSYYALQTGNATINWNWVEEWLQRTPEPCILDEDLFKI